MLGASGFIIATALRIVSISAWAVMSPVSSTRFCPRATISPSFTITAPKGPPQLLTTDSVASRHASAISSSGVISHSPFVESQIRLACARRWGDPKAKFASPCAGSSHRAGYAPAVNGGSEVMTWDDLGRGVRALAEAVAADGYRPDMILGIARGGLLVAGAIGYALGVKNTATINVEFYTGIDERLDVAMILPPVPDLVDFADFKLLI